MIERVAKAICESQEADIYGHLPERGVVKAAYRQQARAAIEAMREPTETMVSAAEDVDEIASQANLAKGGPGRGAYFEDMYRAALDATLSQAQEPAPSQDTLSRRAGQ